MLPYRFEPLAKSWPAMYPGFSHSELWKCLAGNPENGMREPATDSNKPRLLENTFATIERESPMAPTASYVIVEAFSLVDDASWGIHTLRPTAVDNLR